MLTRPPPPQLPAMNYLLAPDEHGPLRLGLPQLMVWSLGLCYFGVVFAVPLVCLSPRLSRRWPMGSISSAEPPEAEDGDGR